jgi:hypothetical protein
MEPEALHGRLGDLNRHRFGPRLPMTDVHTLLASEHELHLRAHREADIRRTLEVADEVFAIASR